ncbi:unnamed protein product [Prunus armeniaca]
MKEIKATSEEDLALKEMTIPIAKEAQEQARARTLERKRTVFYTIYACMQHCLQHHVQVRRILILNLTIAWWRKEDTYGEKDALKAYKVAQDESDGTSVEAEGDKVSSALIDKVDAMLQNLETEIDDIDAHIGDRWQLLDR